MAHGTQLHITSASINSTGLLTYEISGANPGRVYDQNDSKYGSGPVSIQISKLTSIPNNIETLIENRITSEGGLSCLGSHDFGSDSGIVKSGDTHCGYYYQPEYNQSGDLINTGSHTHTWDTSIATNYYDAFLFSAFDQYGNYDFGILFVEINIEFGSYFGFPPQNVILYNTAGTVINSSSNSSFYGRYADGVLGILGMSDIAYPSNYNVYRSTAPLTDPTTANIASQTTVISNALQGSSEGMGFPDRIIDNTITDVTQRYYYYYINDMAGYDGETGSPIPAPQMLCSAEIVVETPPLDTPTVTTAATETTVTPTWAAVANASSYKVRYGTSNPPTGDGETTTSGTAITGLTAGTVYYVQTKAIGDDETYSDSEWSTVSSVRTSKTWVVTNATDTPASGLLTIREAIANAFTGDTIHFSPSIANSTIVLGGTELFIDGKGLVIDGESINITLSGNNASMVLRTAGDTNVCVFRNLKITQGSTSVYHGAGICNYAILTVENCTICNNHAVNSKNGGGVFSGRSLLMRNCTLYDNSGSNGGAVGITGAGTITLDHCTVCNNTATQGGALYNTGTITLIDTIIYNNTGSTDGIYNTGTLNASYTLAPSTSIWNGTNTSNYAYDNALPLFVDTANDNFNLAYNSQALGKSSTSSYLGAPTLLQLAPPVPNFGATGETSFMGGWTEVENASSYKIRYGTTNPPTGDGSPTYISATTSGLEPGTTYYIQVKSVGNGTVYCDSDWCAVQTVLTEGTALLQLTSPVANTSATENSITAVFSAVANATSYKVRYSSTNPPTGDGNSYTSGASITGLRPTTIYYLQFKSVGDGVTYRDSDWSSTVIQATTCIAFRVVQTVSSSLNAIPIVPGTLIVVTDTQALYADIVGGTRIALSAYTATDTRLSTLESYHAN